MKASTAPTPTSSSVSTKLLMLEVYQLPPKADQGRSITMLATRTVTAITGMSITSEARGVVIPRSCLATIFCMSTHRAPLIALALMTSTKPPGRRFCGRVHEVSTGATGASHPTPRAHRLGSAHAARGCARAAAHRTEVELRLAGDCQHHAQADRRDDAGKRPVWLLNAREKGEEQQKRRRGALAHRIEAHGDVHERKVRGADVHAGAHARRRHAGQELLPAQLAMRALAGARGQAQHAGGQEILVQKLQRRHQQRSGERASMRADQPAVEDAQRRAARKPHGRDEHVPRDGDRQCLSRSATALRECRLRTPGICPSMPPERPARHALPAPALQPERYRSQPREALASDEAPREALQRHGGLALARGGRRGSIVARVWRQRRFLRRLAVCDGHGHCGTDK